MSIEKTAHRRQGFSLLELLITVTIFALVAVMCGTVLIYGLRSAKKIQAQISLYSEAQALMDQISRDVERNTIDYEAYYARAVQGDTGWATPNYGLYAQSFYNPGSGGVDYGPYDDINDTGTYYGASCSGGGSYPEDCPSEIPEYDQLDLETGIHPFDGIDDFVASYDSDPGAMNAFCESTAAACEVMKNGFQSGTGNGLILVNADGDERIAYALEKLNASSAKEYSLSRVVLSGTDTNTDGVVDTWTCADGYSCTGTGNTPSASDLTSVDTGDAKDFIPLTPKNLTVSQFYVIVSPLEDPYRAFGEAKTQVQPQVTILMTVSLSNAYTWGLLGKVPSITLQRTVSTGVYSKIPSYE